MAFPAALMLIGVSTPWSESRTFWPLATSLCCVSAVAGSFVIGGQSALMADEWLQMTRFRSDFLFPLSWQTADWQANALPLLTVLLASQVIAGTPQRLARAAFWVASCGLLLAVLAGTILPLQLLLQGQPWRWIWLCSVLAIVLLPATLANVWRHSLAGRAVALLTATAWLLGQWSSADRVSPIGVAGLLLACALVLWRTRNVLRAPLLRVIVVGATVGVVLTLLGVALSIAAVLAAHFDFGTDPIWVQAAADVLEFDAAVIGLVTAAWWFTIRSWSRVGGAGVGVAAAILALGALPGAADSWLAESYSSTARTAFSEWRERIPSDAEVLWPDGLQETWFLLDRRSYLTLSQLGGVVFSAELAKEARRRAEILTPLVPPGHWFADPRVKGKTPARINPDSLARVCVAGGPDFVVDDESHGNEVATVEWPTRAKFRYLYDCGIVRQAASAGGDVAPVTDPTGQET